MARQSVISERDSWLGSFLAAGLNLVGSLITNESNAEQARANRQLALNTARNSIRWKTADLRAAGLNPILAANSALGGSAPSIPASIPQTNSLAGASEILAKASSDSADRSLKSRSLDQTDRTLDQSDRKLDQSEIGVDQRQKEIDSSIVLNDALSAKYKAEELEATSSAALNADKLSKSDKRFENESNQAKSALAHSAAEVNKLNKEAAKIAADTDLAKQRLDHLDIMNGLDIVGQEMKIKQMNLDLLLTQQTISHNEAKLALAKIAINLDKAKTSKDLEKADAEIHLLYRKAYGAKLDDDLKRYQKGVQFDANKERFLRAAERITGVLSKLTGAVTSFSPRSRLLNVTNNY